MKQAILAMAVATSLAAGAARAEPLKVKPGLWETTTTTEKKGNKHPTNLDKLTPEQRAKVEAELAKRGKKETHTVKSCLKAEQIKNGDAFMGKSHHGACTRKPETQTPGELVARVECKGANPMSGKVEMHAADPEHMTGKVDMTYGSPGNLQLNSHSEISARWLGAQCPKAAASKAAHP